MAKNGKSRDFLGSNHFHLATNSDGDLVAFGTYDGSSGLNEVVYVFAMVDGVWGEVAEVAAPEDM